MLQKSGVHQLTWETSRYLQGFIHFRWLFGISFINSIVMYSLYIYLCRGQLGFLLSVSLLGVFSSKQNKLASHLKISIESSCPCPSQKGMDSFKMCIYIDLRIFHDFSYKLSKLKTSKKPIPHQLHPQQKFPPHLWGWTDRRAFHSGGCTPFGCTLRPGEKTEKLGCLKMVAVTPLKN